MRIRCLLIGTLLLISATAHADEVLTAHIWGFKTSSMATGTATFTLRSDLSAIDFVITYENLSSPEVLAHVHRASGPVAHTLPLGTPKEGTWLAPTTQDIAELRSEELYVNIHSEYYPTGEIRGTLMRQVLPVTTSTWGAIKALYR
jgi:hypothetical protein